MLEVTLSLLMCDRGGALQSRQSAKLFSSRPNSPIPSPVGECPPPPPPPGVWGGGGGGGGHTPHNIRYFSLILSEVLASQAAITIFV
jgi:hypothetical protein